MADISICQKQSPKFGGGAGNHKTRLVKSSRTFFQLQTVVRTITFHRCKILFHHFFFLKFHMTIFNRRGKRIYKQLHFQCLIQNGGFNSVIVLLYFHTASSFFFSLKKFNFSNFIYCRMLKVNLKRILKPMCLLKRSGVFQIREIVTLEPDTTTRTNFIN